jgi:hypothetical protein
MHFVDMCVTLYFSMIDHVVISLWFHVHAPYLFSCSIYSEFKTAF